MNEAERALIALQTWVKKNHSGLSIHYTGHNPTIIDGIPHAWSVEIGNPKKKYYCGYGVGMEQAIIDCYCNWQKDDTITLSTPSEDARAVLAHPTGPKRKQCSY